MAQKLIKTRSNRAPSYMTNEESVAWSIGAHYGVRETLAAIQIWLKENGKPELAEELKHEIVIED